MNVTSMILIIYSLSMTFILRLQPDENFVLEQLH
jgi:hypothetical protein